jgi:hypothetical protein
MAGAVPQLQANFAFTKAYLADQAGGRAGFQGPNCFVDSTLFTSPPPTWLAIDATVDWSAEGMSGRSYRVKRLDHQAAGAIKHTGIRDALEISKSLGIKY